MNQALFDYSIVALVSLIAIAGHVWLFAWIRFKMHEGAICHFLEQRGEQALEAIAAGTALTSRRTRTVCHRSKRILAYSSSAKLLSQGIQ